MQSSFIRLKASLFIGRLHPNLKSDDLRQALARLLEEVKGSKHRHDRHHRHHRRHRDSRSRSRSPVAPKPSLWPLVRVAKDAITGESRRYAFAWFKTAKDAERVLDAWRRSNAFFRAPPSSSSTHQSRSSSSSSHRHHQRERSIDLNSVFGDMANWEQVSSNSRYSTWCQFWHQPTVAFSNSQLNELFLFPNFDWQGNVVP